jgi:hypothetical protein
MKRRDKGWGEADSQRAQSTSQPKSPRLELTGRPAVQFISMYSYTFAHARWRLWKPCSFGPNLPVTKSILVLLCLYHYTPARLGETCCPVPCSKQPSKTLPAQREAVRQAAAWVVQDE